MADVVNKLWNFCHTLRHEGVDYGDYIEQLTYLLFLKISDEKGTPMPNGCDWDTLLKADVNELGDLYDNVLKTLENQEGILGDIFAQPIPRINNPKSLKKLILLIDQDHWSSMNIDVAGAAFEGLLERAASEGKKGAGQYFTPRPLIESIVSLVKPNPFEEKDFTISDVACGTGGFLIVAYEWLRKNASVKHQKSLISRKIVSDTYFGQELVVRPRRLALMNMYLHGIQPTIYLGDTIYDPKRNEEYSCILTNPPFGTKGSNQIPNRPDFKVKTSNKQLNFLQHIASVLKPRGRAAVVLPDSCLSEDKATEIWKILFNSHNVHTILKLPRGTFTPYAQGVKACVIFLQKGSPTREVWIYDLRSNIPGITKNSRPLTREHFAEFEKCYGSDPNANNPRSETERFKRFTIDYIKENGYTLDYTWIQDKSLIEEIENTTTKELIEEAIIQVNDVLSGFNELLDLIEKK